MNYDFATREELDEKTTYYREQYRFQVLRAVGNLKDTLGRVRLTEIDNLFCFCFLTYEYRYRFLRLLQQEDDLCRWAPARADEAAVVPLPARERYALERGLRRMSQHQEAMRRLNPLLEIALATDWKGSPPRPIEIYGSEGDDDPCVIVVVYSAACRGWNLTDLLELAIDRHGLPVDPTPGDVYRVAATYALIRSTEAPPEPFDPLPLEPRQFPCVAVRLPVPLPSPAGVGREYDTVVRDRLGWHRLLVGTEGRGQDDGVAVRTWAVTLLMNTGIPFTQAMRQVCEAGAPAIAEVSQAKYGEDRRRLVERVPEAYGMLVQPERDRSGCKPDHRYPPWQPRAVPGTLQPDPDPTT